MYKWETRSVCKENVRGEPLGKQGTQSPGKVGVCAPKKRVPGALGKIGFPCLPFYASVLLPAPGHSRGSINTRGIKPDGLYTFGFC